MCVTFFRPAYSQTSPGHCAQSKANVLFYQDLEPLAQHRMMDFSVFHEATAITSDKELKQATTSKPDELVRHIRQQGPAPVHLWNPPFCGDMDMRIAADGTWYHEGSPLRRIAMVKLFASVLKREGDEYFLVTPVEKLRIKVDDCPFVANQLEVIGSNTDQALRFTTNTGESVTAGAEHIIKVELGTKGEPHPRLHVRSNLWALIHRNVFYQLVDLAEHRHGEDSIDTGVFSRGEFFLLGSYSQRDLNRT